MARAFVDEADAARMGYIAQVFSSLGFTVVEARSRAFLLYSYEVAESLLGAQGTDSQRAERARLVEQLLQTPLPAASPAAPPTHPPGPA